MNRWKGYSYEQIKILYRQEMPGDFTTRFPPPERQDLSNGPASKDHAARRAGARFNPIVGQPWNAEFRRLMSDERAMARLREWFPVRWSLTRLDAPRFWGFRRREERLEMIRMMTLYLQSNYSLEQISAITGAKLEIVEQSLRRAAGIMSEAIGPLGEALREIDPKRFQAGLKPDPAA